MRSRCPGLRPGSCSELVPGKGGLRRLRGAGKPRAVRLGAESARLAELYCLSLLLKAAGSAGDLSLSLAGSRGLARVTGSVAAAAGAGA